MNGRDSLRRTLRVATLTMTLLLALLVAVAATPAASASPVSSPSPLDSAAASPAVKAWTVMVYIDGDNNLESYVTHDIKTELAVPGSNADVNVICLADRVKGHATGYGDWKDTRIFDCRAGLLPFAKNAVSAWGERNLGDPQTLIDFVSWTKTNYPAEHYAIAFWDHGFEWYPENTMSDVTSEDALDEDEFAAAMQAVGPIDVVAWDCCLRQMIEVGATFRPFASVMVGSEEYTNGEGLQYDKIIAALEADPTWTAERLGRCMAATARGDSLTYSSVNLDARWDALITAVDEWSLALIDGLPRYRRVYNDAHDAAQPFWAPGGRDLYGAAFEIRRRVKDPELRAKCGAVMSAVRGVVGYNWHRTTPSYNRTYGGAHGLAIWWPKWRRYFNPSWSSANDWVFYRTKMAFAAQTHWDEFLNAYAK